MRILCALLCVTAAAFAAAASGSETSDLAAARSVFERNLDAIRHGDRDAYLATYLQSEQLARTGPLGVVTGFDDWSKGVGKGWPELLEPSDIHLVSIQPGLVYGTYRYRVRYSGADEHFGISERLFVKTDQGWRIALTGAVDTPAGTPPPPRVIVGATMIDGRGGRPVAHANIVLRDGKIDCAGPQCAVPENVTTIDGKGLWVTPGLIDAHVHFSQTGWADGRPDSLDLRGTHPYEATEAELKKNPARYARTYVCSGITSVFDVGGYAWTLELEKRFANDTSAPHIVAAGPLLSTLDHWLNLPAERQFMVLNDATAESGVAYLASQGARAVKVWYIVRPPDLTVEASAHAVKIAGDAARAHGLPLIVHATGLAEAKASLRAGASVLVHSVWDQPLDDEFIQLARQNGTILIPTLTVARGYVRMFRAALERKPPTIDDPNHCVDPTTMAKVAETATVDASLVKADALARRDVSTSQLEATMSANLKRLVAAGIPIATGTDAGNPLTLHGPSIYAEMETMQADGMTASQVVTASTLVAARAAGLDKVTGSIEAGKTADLLLLGADPTADVANFRKIRFVARAGVVRTIEEMSAIARAEVAK
jgi:imidazolonepropionase-like amidohydrolase